MVKCTPLYRLIQLTSIFFLLTSQYFHRNTNVFVVVVAGRNGPKLPGDGKRLMHAKPHTDKTPTSKTNVFFIFSLYWKINERIFQIVVRQVDVYYCSRFGWKTMRFLVCISIVWWQKATTINTTTKTTQRHQKHGGTDHGEWDGSEEEIEDELKRRSKEQARRSIKRTKKKIRRNNCFWFAHAVYKLLGWAYCSRFSALSASHSLLRVFLLDVAVCRWCAKRKKKH